MNRLSRFLIKVLFLCLLPYVAPGQSPIVDSLENQLKQPLTDSAIVRVKTALARELIYVDIQKANEYVTQAMSLAEKQNLELEKAYAMRIMGAILRRNGFYVNGAELLLQARTIFRNYNDEVGQANVNISLAHTYDQLGDKLQAVKYNKEAIELLGDNPIKERLGIVYNNLGRNYCDLNEQDSGEYYTRKSLQVNAEINNVPLLQSNYRNLGIILYRKGLYDSSRYYSSQVLALNQKLEDYSNKWAVAEAHLTLAKVAFRTDDLDNVENHLNEAQQLAAENGYLRILLEQMKISFEYYNHIQDLKRLKSAWDQYLVLSDSAKKIDERNKMRIVDWYEDRLVKDSEIKAAQSMVSEKDNQIVRLAFILIFAFAVLFLVVFLYSKINKTNKLLNEQKKELERLNKTKMKFFSIIAHDFRNPLAQVSGFSNLMSEHINDLEPNELKKMANQMNDSVKNTIAMTDNLLAWARSQMEGVIAQPVLLDLKDILYSLQSLLASQAQVKGVKLNFDLKGPIEVFADFEEMTLVFRNLITNAIKFSSEGDEIVVKAWKEGTNAIVSITDRGTGMDKKTLSGLFDISIKSSRKGTAGEAGTGLGLILCKEFIEKANGKIEVESTPDVGSTFKVSLPIAK